MRLLCLPPPHFTEVGNFAECCFKQILQVVVFSLESASRVLSVTAEVPCSILWYVLRLRWASSATSAWVIPHKRRTALIFSWRLGIGEAGFEDLSNQSLHEATKVIYQNKNRTILSLTLTFPASDFCVVFLCAQEGDKKRVNAALVARKRQRPIV